MKGNLKKKFKNGAASFYIVAFSTLILVIIVASFTAVIISEITRTSNDDLAQSAYDSALAGVEDAKLAVYNYQSCLEDASKSNCANVLNIMDGEKRCSMVAEILGRTDSPENFTEVIIAEKTEGDNSMQQAYTCVEVNNKVRDIQGTLSDENQIKVVKAQFDEKSNVFAKNIKKVRVNWYEEDPHPHYNLYSTANGVLFPDLGVDNILGGIENTFLPTPPVISLGLVQTAESFNLSDFDKTIGDTTDRGMVYLVPADLSEESVRNKLNSTEAQSNYISAYKNGENTIPKSGFLNSNSKVAKNLPYVVGCEEGGAYPCSATIELPEPVNGSRNDDTFMFVVALPYGGPATQFSLEFLCADDTPCSTIKNEEGEETDSEIAEAYNVQIKVDSTGRANTLYKRVEARLEPTNEYSISTLGPLEILGTGEGSDGLYKNFYTTCEYDKNPTCD